MSIPRTLWRRIGRLSVAISAGALLLGVAIAMPPTESASPAPADANEPVPQDAQLATFGSGCFWCTEAVFQELAGVAKVTSGYAGGSASDASYKIVSMGRTQHAEVVQVAYDPQQVEYATLLEVFWKTHDPTTPNRQGADVGPQYRSAIFYHDPQQKKQAEEYKAKLDASGVFDDPIVTEITAYEGFFPAEGYHQDYYSQNPTQPYCRAVIGPKLEKFRKVFGDKLKDAKKKPDGRTGAQSPATPQGDDASPVKYDEAELRKRLTELQYQVTQQAGTERAFTGEYWNHKETGKYTCIVCGEELFTSGAKFDSHCGWPSFTKPAEDTKVSEHSDTSHMMVRTEVRCKKCGAHLGHVFNDGPADRGGLRYCINSASLDFEPAGTEAADSSDE